MKLIDKSNGYIFAGIEGSVVEFSKIAAAPLDWDYYRYPSFIRFVLFFWNFEKSTMVFFANSWSLASILSGSH